MFDLPLSARMKAVSIQFAEKTAIEVEGRSYNYALMGNHARLLMSFISEQTHQTVFLLSTRKSYAAYVAVLGAVQQACTYIPVNPDLPIKRVEAIIKATSAKVVLVGEPDRKWAATLCARDLIAGAIVVSVLDDGAQLKLDLLVAPNADFGVRSVAAQANPIAYIMFTSGTTGAPKGIPIRHANLMAYLRAIEPITALDSNDRCSQIFDLSFDLSVHDCLVSWSAGACLCIPTKSDLFQLARYVKRYNITTLFCVPSAVRQIVQGCVREPEALNSLRLSLFCGEALTVQDALSWLATVNEGRHWNLYGPTEATIAISAFEMNPTSLLTLPYLTVPIGYPIGDAAFDLRKFSDGGQELWMCGEQVFEGYLEAHLNEGTLLIEDAGRSYRTGDLATYDDRCGYVFKGRRDGQVKINGYRIELLDIEATLERCLKDIIVYVLVEHDEADPFIHVYAYGASLTEGVLRAACAEHLPRYMLPKRISVLDRPHLNSNGKKDRKSVLQSQIPTSEVSR